MTYLDWVEAVFKAAWSVRDRHKQLMIAGVPSIAEELGVNEHDPAVRGAFHTAITDLQQLNLLGKGGWELIGPTPASERARDHGMRVLWPNLLAAYLPASTAEYLGALVAVSERRAEVCATVDEVQAAAVFQRLGWEWDQNRAHDLEQTLIRSRYAKASPFMGDDGLRPTYAGVLRAQDEPGALLAEGRLHLDHGHLRAAGCVVGVEVERRLKELLRAASIPIPRQGGIRAMNQLLRNANRLDVPSFERIATIGALRDRCAHVLDAEPTADDVSELLEQANWFLRTFADPAIEGPA